MMIYVDADTGTWGEFDNLILVNVPGVETLNDSLPDDLVGDSDSRRIAWALERHRSKFV